MDHWISVYETDLLYRAELVKDILNNEDVDAVILNRKDSSYHFGSIQVMVNPEDREKAAKIVKSIHCE